MPRFVNHRMKELDRKVSLVEDDLSTVQLELVQLQEGFNDEFGAREYFEGGIRDDMLRAGLDPQGTVGLAQVHLMVEKIQQLEAELRENDFDIYQTNAMETMRYTLSNRILFVTLGLVGEAGEVANKVKKIYRDNEGVITNEHRENIAKELGDVLWYMATLCQCLGIKMSEVASRNIQMLASRQERGVLAGDGDDR